MFKYFKVMLALSFIFSFALSSAFAQEHTHKHTDAVTGATPKLGHDEVVITGRIICLDCHLKQKKQAKAQCSIYGHTNAIIIEKAINPEGKHVAGAEGKIYQFLHNDLSDELVKDHDFVGKIIVITGKIYLEANVLEVDSFKQK